MKFLPPLLFLTAFIGLFVGANTYFANYFAAAFDINNTYLQILFWGFTVLMFYGMSFVVSLKPIGKWLYLLAGVIQGSMIYLLLSVLFTNLIQLFVTISPLYAGVLPLAVTALTVIYGIWNAYNTRLTEIEIPITGLEKNIKAVHLTDIHLGHARDINFLQKIVDKTNQQNPDVVFLTGDLFDGRINLAKEVLQPFLQLKAPMYFVRGNHDNHAGANLIADFLRTINVRVLENEIAHFGEFQIIGLNHMRADENGRDTHTRGNRNTIQTVLANMDIDQQKPTILLHHSPDGVAYANEKGVDLYLSGHTHAGQLFPITYLAELLFAYNRGLHYFKNTAMFVSEGIGTFAPPIRVGTKSEIVSINLKPM